MKKYTLIIAAFTFAFSTINAQTETKPEKEYVTNVFLNTQLVNAQTTEVLPKKSWEFKIQHRFGKIGLDSTLYQEFLGMDQTANIRLSLAYSINDRFNVAIGRTKYLKNYDFEGKYQLIKQAKGQKIPVSVALYGNAAIRTEKFPSVPANSYFSDWTTDFEYKFAHRVSYSTELIISSKLSNAISLQLAPIYIHRNLVDPGQLNHTVALSFSGRMKIGLKSSVVFEYGYVFNSKYIADDFVHPASIGYEVGTAGHAFQIFISSTQSILDQQIYTNSSIPYGDGEFLLGFSIKRNFWRK